jgi:DMSO/TMAO reductase YedYZ molybdopterin-dependent catalytic subunit
MLSLSRRGFLSLGAMATGSHALLNPALVWADPVANPKPPVRPFLFHGIGPGRGNPPPHKLEGDDLIAARLTPESWKLEIVGDGAKVEKPRTLGDDTAIDFSTLLDLGKMYGIKFIKVMQCRSGNSPQNQGVWEGVPLREVLKLCGKIDNVARVYGSGFHNNDPKQLFQSSATYTQVTDSGPGELPVCIAYKYNDGPIPLVLGGPVRLVIPWTYGFKNIKWLQRLRLTNESKYADTYGGEPDAYLKTQIPRIDGPNSFQAAAPVTYYGRAIVGLPGLKRVEYWLRPDTGTEGELAADDEAWKTATWQLGEIDAPPDDWSTQLPKGISSQELWGFDDKTGKPKDWPLRYTVATWTVTLKDVKPGSYELRVRSVDQNGHAQPQPRPQLATGRNAVPCKIIKAV